jgi:hypothetical protein
VSGWLRGWQRPLVQGRHLAGGTSIEIAEQLYSHAAFREIDDVAFALPFTFDHDDYIQILTDIATKLGRALGWQASQ